MQSCIGISVSPSGEVCGTIAFRSWERRRKSRKTASIGLSRPSGLSFLMNVKFAEVEHSAPRRKSYELRGTDPFRRVFSELRSLFSCAKRSDFEDSVRAIGAIRAAAILNRILEYRS